MKPNEIPEYKVLPSLPHGNGKAEDALELPGIRIENRVTRYCLVIPASMVADMDGMKALFQQLEEAGYLSLPKDRPGKYIKNLLLRELPQHVQLEDAGHGFLNIHSLGSHVEFTITRSPKDRTRPEPKEEPPPPRPKPAAPPPPPIAEQPAAPEQAIPEPDTQAVPEPAPQTPALIVEVKDKEHEQGVASEKETTQAPPAAPAPPEFTVWEKLRAYISCGIFDLGYPGLKKPSHATGEKKIVSMSIVQEDAHKRPEAPLRTYVNDHILPYDPKAIFRAKLQVNGSKSTRTFFLETSRNMQEFADNLTAAKPDWFNDKVRNKAEELRKLEQKEAQESAKYGRQNDKAAGHNAFYNSAYIKKH